MAGRRDFGEKLPDGKWILPSLWLGLWTFASPGTSIIGAVAGGWFQDWAGRRASLAVGSFLCAVGVAISFVSGLPSDINNRRGVFLAGKGVQGGAIGMVLTTTQTYISEIVPPNLRGPMLAFFPIFTLLGQLIGAGVIYACLNLPNGYTICFATQWAFSGVPFILSYAVPESPTYLVRKGCLKKRAVRSGASTAATFRLKRLLARFSAILNGRATARGLHISLASTQPIAGARSSLCLRALCRRCLASRCYLRQATLRRSSAWNRL